MEEKLIIPTKDGKKIYGKVRGLLKGTTIIFVHGLGGRMDQHIFYNDVSKLN